MNEQARIALPVLLPAIGLAAAAFLLAWKPWKRTGVAPRGEWGTVLAFGAAYIVAIFVQAGQRGLQLKESWHWQWVIAASAMAIGIMLALAKPRGSFKLISVFVAAIGASLLFHPPASAGNPILWKAIVGVVVLFNFIALEPLAVRRTGAMLPLCFVVVFGCFSIVLLESHFANFSLMAAAMSAVAGVGFVFALFTIQASMARGGMLVIATVLALLLVTGWLYGKPEVRLPLILMQASVLLIWLGEIQPLHRKPWVSLSARVAAIAACGVIAILLMVRSNAAEESIEDEYSNYYSSAISDSTAPVARSLRLIE